MPMARWQPVAGRREPATPAAQEIGEPPLRWQPVAGRRKPATPAAPEVGEPPLRWKPVVGRREPATPAPRIDEELKVAGTPPGLEGLTRGGKALPEGAPSQTSTQENDSAADEEAHADTERRGCPSSWAAPSLPPAMERVFHVVEEVAGETFALKFRGIEASLEMSPEGHPSMKIELKLSGEALDAMVSPLAWLECGLSRDMVGHNYMLWSMERSKWGSRLDFTCVPCSGAACWDWVRWGQCPRGSRCRWSHPDPIHAFVTVAGMPLFEADMHLGADLGGALEELFRSVSPSMATDA